MKRSNLVTALCLYALLVPAMALAGSPDKAHRLLEVMRAEQNMDNMLAIYTAAMQKSMLDQCQSAKEGQQSRCTDSLPRVSDFLSKRMAEVMAWSALEPELRQVYAQTLTDVEMDAAIAFYSSPEGQSFLAKVPQVMQRGAQIGQRRMEAAMPGLRAELKALFEQIERERLPAAPADPEATKAAADASWAAHEAANAGDEK